MEFKNRYSRNVGPRLQEKLEELANEDPMQRNSLRAESDLARALASSAVHLYDKAEETDDERLKIRAAANMREQLETVSRLVEKAAKVNSLTGGAINVEFLDFITSQVMLIIEKFVVPLPGGKDAVDEIAGAIKKIRLPEKGVDTMTPERRAQLIRTKMAEMDKLMGERMP